jgi:formylglycine-generating enzyme required for sulfatase activity
MASGGHIVPAGSIIDTPTDGKGVIIRRGGPHVGDVTYSNIYLRWEFLLDGAPLMVGGNVDVAVCAIEMVGIDQGAFQVGSGGDEGGHFFTYPNTNTPFTISSEGTVSTASTNGALWGTSGTIGDSAVAASTLSDVPADFPKGYHRFYVMKYEISQGQYAQFLGMLEPTQAANRHPDQFGLNRHTITNISGVYTATVPDRACNFLNWADGAAYADWVGLRPMSEFEYEKACRGTNATVANEYAWGDTNVASDAYVISNDGLAGASVSNAACCSGNQSYTDTDGTLDGPLRCGVFAASVNSPTRAGTGSSWLGIMELGGNLAERVVTIGNAMGRLFTGLHGDGSLDASGFADVGNWPPADGDGAGSRGGSWSSAASETRVSDRSFAAQTLSNRVSYAGFRCVRTAP